MREVKPKSTRRLIWLIGLVVIVVAAVAGYILLSRQPLNRTSGLIISHSKIRSYLIHVPAGYQPGTPTPLVISFHGYGSKPEDILATSGWNKLADQENFIVVYPEATGSPKSWSNVWDGRTSDVDFVSDLIDQLSRDYTLDPKRIYANGHSNGGGMAFLLSCTLSERIAAFGGVSGAYHTPWEKCNPSRPVPAIIIHGTADPTVPYEGSPASTYSFSTPNIPEWTAALAQRNGCAETPLTLPALGEVTGVQYTNCIGGADVILYTVAEGGHSWPGSPYPPPEDQFGHASMDADATRLMWDFFKQHPLP